MKLYALHDKKAQMLTSFHVEKSDAVASRGFAEAVNQAGSIFGKYPDDFELVSVADIVDESSYADLVTPSGLCVVLTAAQVVAMRPKQEQLSLVKEA